MVSKLCGMVANSSPHHSSKVVVQSIVYSWVALVNVQ